MYNTSKVAETIKEVAKNKGYSIAALLKECGLGKDTINTMARRGSWVQADSLAKIADCLDCSVDYLLGRPDNPSSHKGDVSVSANNISGNGAVGVGNVVHNNVALTSEQQQIIDMYTNLDLINKTKLLQYLDLLSKMQGQELEKVTNATKDNVGKFIELDVKDLIGNGVTRIVLEHTLKCARCGKKGRHEIISGVTYSNNYTNYVAVFYFCYDCNEWFVATYRHDYSPSNLQNQFFERDICRCEPCSIPNHTFGKYIDKLSPKFVEIYNQSEYAEKAGLTQIAGMGYRKAAEFLIKDFAIHFNLDKEDIIKSMKLGGCIKYIDNPKIKTLAEKSTWLGNDETHYVRKHMDRDVSDLKIFMNACIGYIESEMAVEDANSIPNVK